MSYYGMYHFETEYQYRAKEMLERADQERLALSVISGQRRMRFYYPAIARFGRWLMVSGHHLQKRYGEMCEISTSQPVRRSV